MEKGSHMSTALYELLWVELATKVVSGISILRCKTTISMLGVANV